MFISTDQSSVTTHVFKVVSAKWETRSQVILTSSKRSSNWRLSMCSTSTEKTQRIRLHSRTISCHVYKWLVALYTRVARVRMSVCLKKTSIESSILGSRRKSWNFSRDTSRGMSFRTPFPSREISYKGSFVTFSPESFPVFKLINKAPASLVDLKLGLQTPATYLLSAVKMRYVVDWIGNWRSPTVPSSMQL